MQIVSNGDKLHKMSAGDNLREMSNHVFYGK